jgi:hypothetical protein
VAALGPDVRPFLGRAVAALAADPNVLERSGGVFITPELAREYGFTDVDGTQMSPFWKEYLEIRSTEAG